MSKTQAFKAFELVMRCLLWIMHQMNGIGVRQIEDEYIKFMRDEGVNF